MASMTAQPFDWAQHEGLLRYTLAQCGYPSTHPNWEDVAQEARIALWQAAETFNPDLGNHWSHYAIVCMRNAVYQWYRRQHRPNLPHVSMERQTAIDSDGHTRTLEDTLADPSDGPEEYAMTRALRTLVGQWFGTLPARDARCLQAHWAGEYEREICQQVGLSQTYVSRIITRRIREMARLVSRAGWPVPYVSHPGRRTRFTTGRVCVACGQVLSDGTRRDRCERCRENARIRARRARLKAARQEEERT